MFRIKFVRYPASIAYLCHMYLITTFKILYIEYWPIYQISEFSYSLISLSASAPKIPYWSGPSWQYENTQYYSALSLKYHLPLQEPENVDINFDTTHSRMRSRTLPCSLFIITMLLLTSCLQHLLQLPCRLKMREDANVTHYSLIHAK